MKKQLTLIVVLIVVAAAFFGLVDPFGWFGRGADELAEHNPGSRVLCDLEESEMTAFTITKPDEGSIRLERDGDEWFVVVKDRLVKARSERIDKFLEELPGLESEAVLTDKPEKHAEFEVDEVTGIRLDIDTAGQPNAVSLMVGKAAPGYKGAFVRVGTGAEVYRAEHNIKSLVGFSIDDYKTRTPWEFNTGLAEKFTFRPEDGDELVLTRSDGFWRKPDGGNANQNKVTEMLDKFSKLQLSSYADDATVDESGIEMHEPVLSVSGPFGEIGITLGNVAENKYYATDGSGGTYRVTEYNLKFLTEADPVLLALDDTPQAAEEEAPGKEVPEAESAED